MVNEQVMGLVELPLALSLVSYLREPRSAPDIFRPFEIATDSQMTPDAVWEMAYDEDLPLDVK